MVFLPRQDYRTAVKSWIGVVLQNSHTPYSLCWEEELLLFYIGLLCRPMTYTMVYRNPLDPIALWGTI